MTNTTKDDPSARIKALAQVAEIVTILGMLALALAIGYAAVLLVTGNPAFDSLLRDQLVSFSMPATLTPAVRAVAYLLVATPMVIGLYALHRVRRLFDGYHRGEIMTSRAAHRLSMVGWAVFAIAPASIITQSVARTVLGWLGDPSELLISIGLDDADVMAAVLGLLIVVVGRILREASRISDEYESFV